MGFLTWTVPVLVGSLSADVFLRDDGLVRVSRAAWGAVALMAIGYLLSCGTRFYDVGPSQQGSDTVAKIAESPVVPTATAMRGVWTDLVQGLS